MNFPDNAVVQFTFYSGINGIKSLPDSSGNLFTLESDFFYYFSTKYTDLYATIRQVLLFGGSVLSGTNSDTIAQMIYFVSREIESIAQCLEFNSLVLEKDYGLAVNKWVIAKSVYYLLSDEAPEYFKSFINQSKGFSKRLGDFEYSTNPVSINRNISGFDDLLSRAKEEMELWQPVITSCGALRVNDEYGPNFAVKGSQSCLIPPIGRTWDNNDGVPMVNGNAYSQRYHFRKRL